MPVDSPRVRLSLQLTEPELRELERRAEEDGRSVASYVAVLVAADLKRQPKRFRPMPTRRARRRFTLALPLKHLDREALEKRAAKEMRSMSQYVTRVVVAALAR